LIVAAVAIGGLFRNHPTPFTASPAVAAAVEGNTAFGIDLYRKLADRPGNLFLSPYSIAASLALVHTGARGQTESEIARTLHLHPTQTNLPVAFGELAARMDKLQRWGRVTLTTANSVWCQRDHPFTDAFRNVVRTQFRAEARLVDFKYAAPAASREINAWIARKTRGRIKDLTAPEQFTPATSVVLANAIYFKGKWAAQFKSKDTQPALFSITPEQRVTVPMMALKSEFRMVDVYDEDPALQLLELPYFGHDLSMVVVLPQAVDGLPALERKLNPDNLRVWLASLDRAPARKASVYLPRFTTTQSFDLADVLKSLGMPTAFDVKRADLSGIDGTALLYLSGAIHRAFVEVNESGTEAAAATFFQAKSRGQSYSFVADHPFLFLIREKGSGSILFFGRVVDPR
jgi:serpin B